MDRWWSPALGLGTLALALAPLPLDLRVEWHLLHSIDLLSRVDNLAVVIYLVEFDLGQVLAWVSLACKRTAWI